MSKYMQLTVDVRPFYEKGLKATYPKLARSLIHAKAIKDYDDPALYDLVAKWDKLLYALDGDPQVKDILFKQKEKLKALYSEIESLIADRKLSEADNALYKIEDIFEDIEYDLAGL
ncbi:hypothetical protein [Desulfobacter hydrogenophilus]|nr:hypothetical protein [Desulfobacter hydrogenophilus]